MLKKKLQKGILLALSAALIGTGSICVHAASQTASNELQTETPLPTGTPLPTETPLPTVTPPPTEAPDLEPVLPTPAPVKNGLIKEGRYYRYYVKGKLVKNRWKTINGKRYFFKKNGNAAVYTYKIKGKYYVFNLKGQLLKPKKNSLVKIGTRRYYISPAGNPLPGYHIVNKKLYFADRYGRCICNTKKDNITFTKEGYAKPNSYAKLKMKCMQVVSQITTPNMSQAAKLKRCWTHLLWGIRFHPWEYPDTNKKDWPQTCALELLDSMSGNCYGFATAFAALAKEIGYEPYVIVIPKCHCWVRINGLYWDNMGPLTGSSHSRFPYRSDQIFKF